MLLMKIKASTPSITLICPVLFKMGDGGGGL